MGHSNCLDQLQHSHHLLWLQVISRWTLDEGLFEAHSAPSSLCVLNAEVATIPLEDCGWLCWGDTLPEMWAKDDVPHVPMGRAMPGGV